MMAFSYLLDLSIAGNSEKPEKEFQTFRSRIFRQVFPEP
jgi:hypothetical protein